MAETIKTVLTADSGPMRKEFDRAAATVKGYSRNVQVNRKRNTAAAVGELKALRAEASGQRNLAEEIRQTIRLKEEALRVAKRTGLSEQAALVMLQKRAALQRQIRQQEAAMGSRRLPELDLRAADRIRFVSNERRRSLNQVGRGARNSAMGLLEFSRAAEDAQYGMQGVMNNIGPMLLGFGMRSGVAAVFTLVVVLLYQMAKAYKSLMETIGNEKAFQAQRDAFKKSHEAAMDQIRAYREQAKSAQDAAAIEGIYSAAIQHRLTIQNSLIPQLERELSLRGEQRNLARELQQAEEKLAKARGLGGPASSHQSAEIKNLQEDLATRRQLIAAAESEYSRVSANAETIAGGAAARVKELAKEIDRLQVQSAEAEARLAGERAFLEKSSSSGDSRNAKHNIEALEKTVSRYREELRKAEVERESLTRSEEKSRQEARQSLATLDETLRKNREEILLINQRIEQKRKLATVEAELQERLRLQQEGRAAGLEPFGDLKGAMDDLLKLKEEREKVLELERRRADFAGDVQVLNLKRQGRLEQAKALQEELRMRREARQLALELEISEARALRLIRQKAELERGANGSFGRARSKIRQYEGEVGLGGGRVESRTAGAFLNSELQRRQREQVQVANIPKPETLRDIQSRQLEIQEKQLQIWENLNKA